MMNLDWQ